MDEIIIDGTGMPFGRLLSYTAKQALKGNRVILLNADKIIITGNKKDTIEKYKARRRLKNKADPEKSPHYPRVPHLLVKRALRGMLPWKKSKGKLAYKKVIVYSGDRKEYKPNTKLELPDRTGDGISVGELCRYLEYNKR